MNLKLPAIKSDLVTTYVLATRWNMSQKNVLRICRAAEINEYHFVDNGAVYFLRNDILEMENRIFFANRGDK